MRNFFLFLILLMSACDEGDDCSQMLLYDVRLKVIDLDSRGFTGRMLDGPDTLSVIFKSDLNIQYNRKLGDTVHFDYIRRDRFSKAQIEYLVSTGHGCDSRKEAIKN